MTQFTLPFPKPPDSAKVIKCRAASLKRQQAKLDRKQRREAVDKLNSIGIARRHGGSRKAVKIDQSILNQVSKDCIEKWLAERPPFEQFAIEWLEKHPPYKNPPANWDGDKCYFLIRLSNGEIKIGFTNQQVCLRTDKMLGATGPAVVLGAVPCVGHLEEKNLHDRFGLFRLDSRLEWFDGRILMEVIGLLKEHGINPDATAALPKRIRRALESSRRELVHERPLGGETAS